MVRELTRQITLMLSELREAPVSWDRFVPAVPLWTVRNLIAHLGALSSGLAAGQGFDAFNASLIPEWSRRSVDALADQWVSAAHILSSDPHRVSRPVYAWLIADLVGHRHDLYGIFDRQDGRSGPEIQLALEIYVHVLGQKYKSLGDEAKQANRGGLSSIVLRADNREWRLGEGRAQALMQADDPFELLRAVSGRRSRSQVNAMVVEGSLDSAVASRRFPLGPFALSPILE